MFSLIFRLKTLWLKLLMAVILPLKLAGCSTFTHEYTKESAMHESMTLEFRVLDNKMPKPVIFWREFPGYNETLLVLEPPLPECDQVNFFINPSSGWPNLLTKKAIHLPPVNLSTKQQEFAQWNHISAKKCAVLLTVGTVIERGLVGLSATTPTENIRSFDFELKKYKEGEKSVLMLGNTLTVPWAIALSPILYGTEAIETMRKEGPFTDEVTVSFENLDGTHHQVSLDYKEARQIIESYFPEQILELSTNRPKEAISYPEIIPGQHHEWLNIRFWVRAALMKMKLEFREETVIDSSDENDTEIHLVWVGGQGGEWVFDPRDGRGLMKNLHSPLKSARYLRFKLLK